MPTDPNDRERLVEVPLDTIDETKVAERPQRAADLAKAAEMMKLSADMENAEGFHFWMHKAMQSRLHDPVADVISAVLDGKTSLRIEVTRGRKGPKGSRSVGTLSRDAIAWAVFRALGYPELDQTLPKGALKKARVEVETILGIGGNVVEQCWYEARNKISGWSPMHGALLERMIDRSLSK